MSRLRNNSFLRSRPSIHEIANSILAPRSNFSSCTNIRKVAKENAGLRTAYTNMPSISQQPQSLLHTKYQSRSYSQKKPSISATSTPQPSSSSFTPSPSTTISSHPHAHSHPPETHDRGPPSEETTQTDFGRLDVLGNTPSPSTSIDACLSDGFHLNSGVKVGGDGVFVEGKGWMRGSGVLLVGGEAFGWRPWVVDREGEGEWKGEVGLVNGKGQFEVRDEVWGVLGCIWPRPDLLILGLGKEMRPLAPKTRAFINALGIRIEVADTRNASAQFNLLATERGVGSVAAALIPLGR